MFKVCGSKILDTWIDNLKLLASLVSHLLARGIFKQVLKILVFHWLPVLCPSVIPTALQFVQICLQWRQNTTGTWIDFRNANILLAKKNESHLGAISIDPEHRLSAAWMPSYINSTMPCLDIQTVQNWAMLAAVEVWCKQCNYAVSSDAICWSADLLHHEAIIWDLQIKTFVSRNMEYYQTTGERGREQNSQKIP